MSFFEDFMEEAVQSAEGRGGGASGKLLQVQLDAGTYVSLWIDSANLSKFWVATTKAEKQRSKAEALNYLEENGKGKDTWRIKPAVRLTLFAGTSIIDEGDYPLEQDREIIIQAGQERNEFKSTPEKAKYESTYEWKVLHDGTLSDEGRENSGFDEVMLGQKVWAQIRQRPHELYDADDDSTWNRHTGYHPKDENGDRIESEWRMKFYSWIAKVYPTEVELREYAAAQGIPTKDGEAFAASLDIHLEMPDEWKAEGLSDTDWVESLTHIAATFVVPVLEEFHNAGGDSGTVRTRVAKQISGEYGKVLTFSSALEVFDAMVAAHPPF